MTAYAKPKAVVLLSGGLDSTTVLAEAAARGFELYALTVAYGQRHAAEIAAAKRVARAFAVAEHRIAQASLDAFGGSALTDPALPVPEGALRSAGETARSTIPITYVPARNTVLLALALAWAEVVGATDLFIGANAVDYSGYPDCRPPFLAAFEHLANVATKAGVEGARYRVHAPLLYLSKAEIIRRGVALGVDYGLTVSCYQADAEGRACGRCDSCRLRAAGFAAAGLPDPTRYQTG
ncbi:7-cyano-7-deazaguanine synthase QueC [Hydrogenophilus thiooxidans]|uniref:7-cyano-7-deazaguanine synthase QueC n=1 Tax=Hydrogenophilus thiooxidans TaxID=2820326 RepID=UPI001C238C09|nr:7-cyano-7-deazaguanine synthase QueC [Hydrogenophilus thiooxidans]